MAEPVVILEPGDERAQKVAKAMASQTAGDILRLIGSGQKTATEIAEQLSLPMNTVKYHTENLLEAGLITVASTKYSVKGREVKVYSLTNELLIVAPRQANVRTLLMKYASLFGIVAFGSAVIALISPVLKVQGAGPLGEFSPGSGIMAQEADGTFAKAAADTLVQNATPAPETLNSVVNGSVERMLEVTTSPMVASIPPSPSSEPGIPLTVLFQDPALVFFVGGLFVILILAAYELCRIRRTKHR